MAPAAAPRPQVAAAPAPPAAVAAPTELPDALRRELPALSIGGAMHSDTPAARMLIVNGQVFREGDALAPGLVLEQIQLRSAVLAYKGGRYLIRY